MTTIEFQVTGMSCGHCEAAVRKEVGAVAGVASAEASAATGRLMIEASGPVDDADVIAAVAEAGYTAARAA
jgi:copper chaperone CopZ